MSSISEQTVVGSSQLIQSWLEFKDYEKPLPSSCSCTASVLGVVNYWFRVWIKARFASYTAYNQCFIDSFNQCFIDMYNQRFIDSFNQCFVDSLNQCFIDLFNQCFID